MLSAQVEPYSAIIAELKQYFPLHWQELALNKDKVALAPRYDVYAKCETSGSLSMVTVRDGGKIIAYWVMFFDDEMHYSILASRMDIFWVNPDYRQGPAAVILMRAVEREVKRRGALRWWAGEKLHSPCGRLFKAFGMQPVETYWCKWMGGAAA